MFEKRWKAVPARSFADNGTVDGKIAVSTVLDLCDVKVGQILTLFSSTQTKGFQAVVKQVDADNLFLQVGPLKTRITDFIDITAFTTADSATFQAPEQKRVSIPEIEYTRSTFEEEPTVAWRTFGVDKFGRAWATDNPFPVQLTDGSVNIGTVNAEIEVQLSHRDNIPDTGDVADSTRIGDGVNEQKVDRLSTVNSTSSILGGGAAFSGSFEECLGWSTISLIVLSDQDSASNGLVLEYSSNGTDVDSSIFCTISANESKTYTFGVKARFYRIRYTNGATPQGIFRLQAILHVAAPKPSSHKIGGTIDDQDDAELVKTVKANKNPDGNFTNERTHGIVSAASTTTPLGIGGTFVTPILNLTEYTNVSSSLVSDQAGTLTVEWFADAAGTFLVRSVSAAYTSVGLDAFVSSIKLADYIRITYTNGPVAQTSFILQAWMLTQETGGHVGPIDGFLPADVPAPASRAVITGKDPDGIFQNVGLTFFDHFQTAITDSQTGAAVFIAPNGSLNTAEIIRLVGGNFIDGQPLLDHIWITTVTNGGAVTTPDGELRLSTNGTANGTALVESFRMARFVTATFNLSHQAISTPINAATDVIRRWGCFDPDSISPNGVFFENDSGQIRVVRIKGGVREEVVDAVDFNGNVTFIQDDSVHIYEIIYNAGTIFFHQDRKLVHKMSSLVSAAYDTPHLRIGHSIENINGNTTSNVMLSRGSSISRIGANAALPDFFNINAAGTDFIKNTPGRLHRIIITDKGVGSASITIFNNIVGSGEIIAFIDTADVSGEVEFNVEFDVGLTIVTSGVTTSVVVIYD